MKGILKYRSDNCVIKVGRYKNGKEKYQLVYHSDSLDDCFDYVIGLIRKDKAKRKKQDEQELQNFFEFGDIPNERES